ncbi:DUF2922 domain-containing protein [Domibacillus sp. DTU_2020_1001157_1_SI_ALB_TIR_016]|uniref:DUF2922 domain-containing protein n=1 Tax=Domibacillus sp. DTU_2020_1001157_1_SI_ALB_TIR_016 TaxID=3077789 RepID=UPI0028ECE01E|nr:DUF2922 domain-containing protein [Domibacillus sp. DTU_2020_1001157_1_SI_ALB_TIR_016]WNS81492.1 DUF2922 domain-containing protein [Domibacillus sp. DTU_2020_1001157_1_SI_ALB_TIR_016]
MAKTLQLQFTTAGGGTSSLTIDTPVEPVDAAAVAQAMNAIIASGVFMASTGLFTASKSASLIDREVTEIL